MFKADKLDQIKPKDAIPLLIKIRDFALGKKKPDGFTRLMFTISLFCWVLLSFWNGLSYFVLISSNIIEQYKGFSVNQIIIKNGQNLGFDGPEFLASITDFYFYSLFIWAFIFIGLVFLYRKKQRYIFFVLGGLTIQFTYMFYTLGFQYFLEDVSFFDKILYAVLILVTFLHSILMNKEKEEEPEENIQFHEEDASEIEYP